MPLIAAPPSKIRGPQASSLTVTELAGEHAMPAMNWSRAVRERSRCNGNMTAKRQVSQVVRLHSVTMGFKEAMLPMMTDSYVCTMAACIVNLEPKTSGFDGHDCFGFCVMLLSAADIFDATDLRNAPIGSACNAVENDGSCHS